jgi:hypothetical protein
MSWPTPISYRGLGQLLSEYLAALGEVTIGKPNAGSSMF